MTKCKIFLICYSSVEKNWHLNSEEVFARHINYNPAAYTETHICMHTYTKKKVILVFSYSYCYGKIFVYRALKEL